MTLRALTFGLALLTATSAFAADLTQPAPIAPTPAVNWTGLYVQASAGADWGNIRGSFIAAGTRYNHALSGGLIGAQFGFMKQWDQLVAGAEVGFSAMNSSGSVSCPNPGFTCSEKANTLFEASGTLGFAFDRALVYGKAGWGEESIASSTSPAFAGYNQHRKMGGLLIGLGGKYEVAPNWDIGLEYVHVSLNSQTFSPGGSAGVLRVLNGGDNIVRATLSYRFNFGG